MSGPKTISKGLKVVYPPTCKEVSEDLGKDELVKRLKLLARAFQDMGQDDNDQYAGLALHLACDFLLDHHNKDVRLLVACCLADVFRIFAPDAPFKDSEHLKEIFLFFIKQLRGLEDPDSPSFKRYFYLLENLAWVKSFNICIELDDSQEIFCSLFKLIFSIVSDKHSSKVKNFMLDMMTPLITEADSVSLELLDCILINIVEPHRSQNKHAYNLAKDLIRRSGSAIEPYIQTFFNNTLMLGKTSESDLSSHLYDLIYELNQISPSVLLAVLPQLDFKLKSNQEAERKSVTKLLARMFSEPGSELATQNKPLWNCFIGRFNDISTSVRLICTTFAQHFILNHPELTKDIFEQLRVRQHDPEEIVRQEVVNCVLNVAKKDFSLVSEEMLGFIKERTLDKKFKIRREALLGLGMMYKQVMSAEPPNPAHVEKIAWVKNKVFHLYYHNSNDDRLLVERVFNMHLVPYSLSLTSRMTKLLQLYCTLDDHAVRAFNELLKHRSNVRQLVVQLIEAIDKAGQPNPPPLVPRLSALARTLPDMQKPQETLKKFNVLLRDDKRIRLLLRLLVSPDCTSKKAEDAVKEILKKIGCKPGQQNSMYTMMKYLLERIAPVMIDAIAIEELVNIVAKTITGPSVQAVTVERSIRLVLNLSHAYPYNFKMVSVFENFLTFLRHDDDLVSDITLQILCNVGGNLQTAHPNVYQSMLPVLVTQAKIGNIKQTKHAIKAINTICKSKEPVLAQVFEHVKKNLTHEAANYITSIVALGHIAQVCPQEFLAEMKTIVSKIIVRDLLMQDRTEGTGSEENWYPDHLVSEETQAKIQAMKMLVRWLLGLQSQANNLGTSTLRLLYTAIIHEGDLMEHGKINKPELARLRLQAGCCMLKLAEEPCFAEMITPEQFQALALLINDACYHVRVQFATKLHKGLISMRLPLEYLAILSLAANDPLKERRQSLKQCLNFNITKRKDYLRQNPSARSRMTAILPDYMLPYTIHLLAHDPYLKSFDNVEALKNIKDCLWFVLDSLIGKSEDYNYSFLHKLVECIKHSRDVQGPDDEEMNKKLWAVCDLTMGLLLNKVTNVKLKDSNIEPALPAKLFIKQDKSFVNTQSYLPKEFTFDGSKCLWAAPRKAAASSQPSAPATPPRVPLFKQPKTMTTTEIIVESPAPVVNPNPKCPRVKTERSRKRKQKDDDQSSTQSTQDDSNTSREDDKESGGAEASSEDSSTPVKGRRAGKKLPEAAVKKPKSSPAAQSQKLLKKAKQTAKGVGRPRKDSGGAGAGRGRRKLVNGAQDSSQSTSEEALSTSEVSDSQSSGRGAGKKRVGDAGDSSAVKRPQADSKDKGAGVQRNSRRGATKDSGKAANAEGDTESTPSKPGRKRQSSPSPSLSPSPAVKRSRATRQVESSDSPQTSSQDSTQGKGRGSRNPPSPSKTSAAPIRNARRGRALANGKKTSG